MTQPLAGEIRMFAGNYAPAGWAFCDGQVLNVSDHRALFDTIGATFGGDGEKTFALPDMRGRIPAHRGSGISHGHAGGSELVGLDAAHLPGHSHTTSPSGASSGPSYSGTAVTMVADTRPVTALSGSVVEYAAGGDSAHNNVQPFLSIHFIIALDGDMEPVSMTAPFIGEIRLFAGALAPKGWCRCDGQSLKIAKNQELFAVLGTTYGGDGRDTFSLPDLRGRTSMHAGQGDGLTLRRLGDSGGTGAVALVENHLPYHAHAMEIVANGDAAGNVVVASTHGSSGIQVGSGGLSNRLASAGAGQPHNNLQPYLALNFIIAATGQASV